MRSPSNKVSSTSTNKTIGRCSFMWWFSTWPRPLIKFGLINPLFVGVVLAVNLHIAQLRLDVSAGHTQGSHAVNHIHGKTEAVYLVPNGEVERSVDVALLFVSAHMQVLVI